MTKHGDKKLRRIESSEAKGNTETSTPSPRMSAPRVSPVHLGDGGTRQEADSVQSLEGIGLPGIMAI